MTQVKSIRSDILNLTNSILDLLASLSCPMPNLLPKSTKMITRTDGENADCRHGNKQCYRGKHRIPSPADISHHSTSAR